MNNGILTGKNYNKEAVIVNLAWANIFGIIVLALAALLFGAIFFMIWGGFSIQSLLHVFGNKAVGGVRFIILIIAGMIIHELIHGIFFAMFAANGWRSIKFGILPARKLFTPYCHCKDVIKARNYIIATIMPLIILGIIPAIISLAIGSKALLFFGILFIGAASGDLLIFNKIKNEDGDAWVMDNPLDAGYYIYRQIEEHPKRSD